MSELVSYNSPFLEAACSAYLLWMEQQWPKFAGTRRSLIVAMAPNLTDLRKAQDETRSVDNPLYLVAPARLEPYRERGGIQKKYINMHTSTDINSGKAIIRNLIPVRLGFMTKLRTDNWQEVINYFEMLMNSMPGVVLNLKDEHGFIVQSRISFDDSFELPQLASAGVGDLYEVELPCSITTWLGTTRTQGIIKAIEVQYVEGTGSYSTPISIDKKTGKVLELERFELTYQDLFDSKSNHFKGSV